MTIYDDSGNCQSNFYYEATTDCWVTFSIEAIREREINEKLVR